MITRYSNESEAHENAHRSFLWHLGVRQRWIAFGCIAIFLAVVFMILAPFTVNPLALSPLGMSLVLIPFLFLLWSFLKRLRQWVKRENLAPGSMAFLILASSPVQPSAPVPSPFWNMMYDNVTLMGNTAAWQASFDFNPDIGLPGYASLFYRPLVADHPVTLVAIPGQVPGTYEPFAVVSGLQAVPFTDSHAIWNTLPQQQTLHIQHTVLLTNDLAAYQPDPQMMIGMLSVNCTECQNAFQLNINPEYGEKLAWDTGIFVVGQVPLGRVFKVGDAITGVMVSNHLIHGDLQAAGATASGWVAGQFVDFVDVDSSETWVGGLASHLTGNLVEKAINPGASGLAWNFQVYDGSIGIATHDFDAYAWQSQAISTYSGSFIGTDWQVETRGKLHFAHVSSADLDITNIQLPELFYENMNILNQPLTTIPPVTFSPTEFELPDIDIWQQTKPLQETFPPPIVDPLPDWPVPEIVPYNPPPIILDPIPNWTVPDNFTGAMPDITPYSPPPTTFEIPDFDSLDTQPFTLPSTTWP